jgi:hypothetical protein
MTLQIVIFGFGAMLLLIGILGGGLELRELKIPQVGRAARLLAAVFGLVFILAGTGMKSESPDPREPQSRNPHVEIVDLMLHDHLGEDQVSEQVIIHIDGRPIGTLTVRGKKARPIAPPAIRPAGVPISAKGTAPMPPIVPPSSA